MSSSYAELPSMIAALMSQMQRSAPTPCDRKAWPTRGIRAAHGGLSPARSVGRCIVLLYSCSRSCSRVPRPRAGLGSSCGTVPSHHGGGASSSRCICASARGRAARRGRTVADLSSSPRRSWQALSAGTPALLRHLCKSIAAFFAVKLVLYLGHCVSKVPCEL